MRVQQRGKTVMEKHDYWPGEDTHPMHTDPLCAVCGYPKNAGVHK